MDWKDEKTTSMLKAYRSDMLKTRLVQQTAMVGIDHSSYGVGGVRPRWLQCLNRPAFFLAFTALAVFIQSMCVNGLIGVSISTLERRFGWRSTEAGLVPAFYDISGLPMLLLVGYYGGRAHKPRWIAAGMMLVGLGSLLFALPHFTTGPYDATGMGSMTSLCEISGDNATSLRCSSAVTHSSLWNYLYLFVVAISLMGMGSVPLYILSLTYYDDCLPRHTAALYTGIFYAFSTIGPAVAYIGGGYILNVHTDVNLGGDHTDVSVDDPRWVGAWWILYIVTGLMAIAVVLPILSYPAEMPGAEEVRKTRVLEVHSSAMNGDVDLEDAKIGWPHIRDIPRVLKLLFLNPTFLCMTLAGVGDAAIVAGFAAFGPKYMQNQFSISAASAGIIFGLLAVPGGAGGSFFGSYIIKRLRMTCSQLLRYHLIISCVVTFLAVTFIIQCRQQSFVGVNVLHGNRSTVSLTQPMTESCNADCGCDNLSYDPVCGIDRLTYFSPCHAGCLITADKTFANCSCLEGSDRGELTATAGMCAASDCHLMALFCFLFFLAMFLIYVAGMFHLCIVLRVVTESQRSLALGLDMLMGRVLGSIPGPLIFGAVIDHSCLLWEKKGCGEDREEGACLYHANASMAWYMMSLCMSCQLLVAFFGFLAWKNYTPGFLHTSCSSIAITETIIMSNNHTADSAVTETPASHVMDNGSCTGEDNIAFSNVATIKQTPV